MDEKMIKTIIYVVITIVFICMLASCSNGSNTPSDGGYAGSNKEIQDMHQWQADEAQRKWENSRAKGY